MKKTTTKGAAKKSTGAKSTTNKGIKGAAEFVRECHGKGMNKTDTFSKVKTQWPAFEHDEAGLESRWNTAVRIAKNAKESAKPAPKAPAKKSAPAKPAAKKSPPKPAQKSAPAPAVAAPPPRPAAQAADGDSAPQA